MTANPYEAPNAEAETPAQKKRRRNRKKFLRSFKNPIYWVAVTPVALYYGAKILLLLLTGR